MSHSKEVKGDKNGKGIYNAKNSKMMDIKKYVSDFIKYNGLNSPIKILNLEDEADINYILLINFKT